MRPLGAIVRIFVVIGVAAASLATGVLIGKYDAFPLSLISAWRHEAKPKAAATTTTEQPKDPAPFAYLPEDVDVVVVGDSLSAGVKWKEVFPQLDITGRAVAGSTVEDLLASCEQVQALTPSVVLILVGINDLRWKVPPDTFLKRLTEYASSFGPDTRVIIQSILPVRDPDRWPGINQKVQAVNRALQRWCEKSGVQFIDLRPALAPSGYLDEECSLDGVHLTGEGIRRWMDALRRSGAMNPVDDHAPEKANEGS